MGEANAPTAQVIEPHASYYFELIIFRVENTLFKVPRHHFDSDSQIFRDMFQLPQGGELAEGKKRERPIHLQGITTNDFVAFLKIICPKHFKRAEILTPSEWLSVLKLSTMWEFTEARDIAIKTLTTMKLDPLDRAEAAKTHRVPQWYWCALRELGEAAKGPSSHACVRLGVDFCLRVAELRGRIAGYKRAATNSDTAATPAIKPATVTKAAPTAAKTTNQAPASGFGAPFGSSSVSGTNAQSPAFTSGSFGSSSGSTTNAPNPTLTSGFFGSLSGSSTNAPNPTPTSGFFGSSSGSSTNAPNPTSTGGFFGSSSGSSTNAPNPTPTSGFFGSSSRSSTNAPNPKFTMGGFAPMEIITPTTPSPPILQFIAELFAEEVKDVPLLACSEDVKKSCRYGQ